MAVDQCGAGVGGSSSSGVKGVILLPCQASLSKVLDPAHLRDGTTNVCDWLLLQMTLRPPARRPLPTVYGERNVTWCLKWSQMSGGAPGTLELPMTSGLVKWAVWSSRIINTPSVLVQIPAL